MAIEEVQRLNTEIIKLYKEGKYAESLQIAQRVLALVEQTLGPTHPDVATSLNNLAELYSAQGQYAEA